MPPGWRRVTRRLGPVAFLLFASAVRAEEPPATPPAPPPEEPSAATATTTAPRTVVRIFGDIDWRSRRDVDPSTFVLGQIDVFLTSELATNVSVLAETVLESPEHEGSQIAEVERFQLQYSPSDALTVSVGRMHTMLGFWNQAYHHGTWLQTTAFRPEVYRWEDEDGGLLPVHEVGVRARRARRRCVRSASSTLRASSTVVPRTPRGSRRSRTTTGRRPSTSGWGSARARSPTCRSAVLPSSTPFRPAAEAGRAATLDERIWGGFVVFQGPRLELLAEAFSVVHRDETAGVEWTSPGLYAQAAWTAGRWKPYYRFDRVDRDEGDPYYGPGLQDVTKHTAGLRVDPWSRVALKLEAIRARVAGGSPFNAAALQAAFTF